MIGQTLGQYRILEELGRSALGVTYLAEDMRLDRRVALRTFSSRVLEDPVWWERIHTAVSAAVRLNHPSIAAVLSIEEAELSSDGGETTTRPFITMEYVPGPSLEEALGSRDTPLETVLAWGASLADALHYAHKNGSVHGALAPAYVKVRGPDALKILDFGMVRIPRPPRDPLISDTLSVSLTTRTALHVEAAAYLAPEQWDTDDRDPRSDVYSLGMVLYRLLSDHPPPPRSRRSRLRSGRNDRTYRTR
jgi:serine/threonine-protein kinase